MSKPVQFEQKPIAKKIPNYEQHVERPTAGNSAQLTGSFPTASTKKNPSPSKLQVSNTQNKTENTFQSSSQLISPNRTSSAAQAKQPQPSPQKQILLHKSQNQTPKRIQVINVQQAQQSTAQLQSNKPQPPKNEMTSKIQQQNIGSGFYSQQIASSPPKLNTTFCHGTNSTQQSQSVNSSKHSISPHIPLSSSQKPSLSQKEDPLLNLRGTTQINEQVITTAKTVPSQPKKNENVESSRYKTTEEILREEEEARLRQRLEIQQIRERKRNLLGLDTAAATTTTAIGPLTTTSASTVDPLLSGRRATVCGPPPQLNMTPTTATATIQKDTKTQVKNTNERTGRSKHRYSRRSVTIDTLIEEVRKWTSEMLKETINESIATAFKDGTRLCKLINRIKPGSVPHIHSATDSSEQHLENLRNYLAAVKTLGFDNLKLFSPSDVLNEKNSPALVQHLFTLGLNVTNLPWYKGPSIKEPSAISMSMLLRSSVSRRISNSTLLAVVSQQDQTTSTTHSHSSDSASLPSPVGSPSKSVLKSTAAYSLDIDVPSLDVDLQAKEVLKYDTELEAGAREWIEAVLGEKLPHPDFLTNLKDGVILCRLLNAIRPNLISKIHTANRGYLHMENITNYLKGCVALGLKRVELFDTIDLYDEKNKYLVLQNIHSLGRLAKSLGFRGPQIVTKTSNNLMYAFDDNDEWKNAKNTSSEKEDKLTEEQKNLLAWVNSKLKVRNICATNLSRDFQSGELFIVLLELLTNQTMPRWGQTHVPKQFRGMQNLVLVLRFVQQQTLEVIDCKSQDIVKGNVEATAELLRFIFKHFDRDQFLASLKLDDRVLNIANEIITSERNYVNFLAVIVEKFLTPLKEAFEKNKLSFERDYVASLFDLFDIHRYHVQLLQELEKCSQHLVVDTNDKSNNNKTDPSIAFETIGSIFTNKVEFLRNYQHYLNEYNPTLYTIRAFAREDSYFGKLIENFEEEQNTKYGLDLRSHIIMPVQRIARYALLLKELEDNLKENPSLQKSLHSAIANVTKILNDLNEAQRQNDQQFRHITKLIEIENSIDQCEEIAHPRRKFIREGPLKMVTSEDKTITLPSRVKPCFVYCFLLSDLLVATVENEDPATQYRYKWQIKDLIPIAFIERVDEKVRGSDNAFLLKFEEGVMFFIASSLNEKQQWVNDIKNARQHVGEVDILLVTNT